MTPTTRLSAALAILRIPVGAILLAHGWQKFAEFTIPGTQQAFEGMGVPAATIVAPLVATIELVGGAALILGILTRVFAALLTIDMLGALFLVHASAGIFVDAGGYELVLALAAGTAALAISGPGAWSVDAGIFGRNNGTLARTLYPRARVTA